MRVNLSIFRRFANDERGNGIVEGAIMLPVMLMAWIGAYAIWEAFASRSAVQKATHVAADLLSREMVAASTGFLDGLDATVEYLVDARFDVSTRFTSFTRTGPGDADVQVLWSYAPSLQTALQSQMTQEQLVTMAGQLPKLSTGNSAIIVETQMGYSMPFTLPIFSMVVPSSFSNVAVLMPRYVPRICREGTPC